MNPMEIPDMEQFGKQLAAEIEKRKAAAEKAQNEPKEKTSETDRDEPAR